MVSFSTPLPATWQKTINGAAALAIVRDLQPLIFTDNRDGMAAFVEKVFKAGQSVAFVKKSNQGIIFTLA